MTHNLGEPVQLQYVLRSNLALQLETATSPHSPSLSELERISYLFQMGATAIVRDLQDRNEV
jgi:hypothetical protein